MKIYIATKLENHAEHNRLRDELVKLGHTITYDWTTHGPVWDKGMDTIGRVAQLEMLGVIAADLVIVLWPAGRGTHTELGIALGSMAPVAFVSDVEGHHSAHPDISAFYAHPLVRRYKSAESLIEDIKGHKSLDRDFDISVPA